MKREDFGLGPLFNFYTPQKGDVVRLINHQMFHTLPRANRERILLLLNLGNRYKVSGKFLALKYMDSVDHPHYQKHNNHFTHRTERNEWREDLELLIKKFIGEIPKGNQEVEV